MKNLMQEQIYRDFGEKEAWRYVKNSFLDNDDQIPTLVKGDKVAETNQEKADLLIEHYAQFQTIYHWRMVMDLIINT